MPASTFLKKEPFLSKIKERSLISKPGSTKEVYHICLDVKGLDLVFRTGDSLAIYPHNDPVLVQNLLNLLKATGKEWVIDQRTSEKILLIDFLTKRANITKLTSKMVKFLAPYLGDEMLNDLSSVLNEKEIGDLLQQTSSTPLQGFCDHLCPLLPRFYSIASSPLTHPHEIHLTVAAASYFREKEQRYGVASHYLCHLTSGNHSKLSCFVQTTKNFTLPKDPSLPIIMIGAGTGIAPFRSFLLERCHTCAPGKNWLFFGERQKAFDFYYESFFNELVSMDKLKIETAFSRDQKDKIYVQHKMLLCAKELWVWLQDGAIIYVAGAKEMGKEIDKTLHTIARQEGNYTQNEATAFLQTLKKEKRYLLDTY